MTQKTESTFRVNIESLLQSLRHDEKLREQFQNRPREILKSHGLELAPNSEIRVLTSTPTKTWLVVREYSSLEESNPLVACLQRANRDSAFFAELQADPKTILKDYGFETTDEVEVEVVRDTDSTIHIVIEEADSIDEQISDSTLESVSGGYLGYKHSTRDMTGTVGHAIAMAGHLSLADGGEALGGLERAAAGTIDMTEHHHTGLSDSLNKDARANYGYVHSEEHHAAVQLDQMKASWAALKSDAEKDPVGFMEALLVQGALIGATFVLPEAWVGADVIGALGETSLEAGETGLEAGETGVDAGETGVDAGRDSSTEGENEGASGLRGSNAGESGEGMSEHEMETMWDDYAKREAGNDLADGGADADAGETPADAGKDPLEKDPLEGRKWIDQIVDRTLGTGWTRTAVVGLGKAYLNMKVYTPYSMPSINDLLSPPLSTAAEPNPLVGAMKTIQGELKKSNLTSDNKALDEETIMLAKMPLSSGERQNAYTEANRIGILKTLNETKLGHPVFAHLKNEIEADGGDINLAKGDLAGVVHWLTDTHLISEQDQQLKEKFINHFAQHRGQVITHLYSEVGNATDKAIHRALAPLIEHSKNGTPAEVKSAKDDMQHLVAVVLDHGVATSDSDSPDEQYFERLHNIATRVFDAGDGPMPKDLSTLPQSFINSLREERGKILELHLSTAALEVTQHDAAQASSIYQDLAAQGSGNLKGHNLDLLEQISGYSDEEHNALGTLSAFGADLDSVELESNKQAVDHVLAEAAIEKPRWADTPEKLAHLKTLITESNLTTTTSPDGIKINVGNVLSSGFMKVHGTLLPAGFFESYVAARTNYLGSVMQRYERAYSDAIEQTSVNFRHEYAAFEQAIEIGKTDGHSSWSIDSIGSILAAHSTDTGANKQGRIENTLRQIDDGTLKWTELHVPHDFIRQYESSKENKLNLLQQELLPSILAYGGYTGGNRSKQEADLQYGMLKITGNSFPVQGNPDPNDHSTDYVALLGAIQQEKWPENTTAEKVHHGDGVLLALAATAYQNHLDEMRNFETNQGEDRSKAEDEDNKAMEKFSGVLDVGEDEPGWASAAERSSAESERERWVKRGLELIDEGKLHWSDVTEKYAVPITTDFISKYKHNKAHGFIWKGDHPPPSEWLKIADHGYRSDNAREIKQLEAEQHSTPGEKDPFAGVVMSAGGFGGEGGGNADAPNQHGVVIDKRGEATSYGYDPAQDWPHMDSLKHFVKSFKEKFDHNLELLKVNQLSTLSYDQVTKPHEQKMDEHSHAGKLLQTLHELPTARLYGVQSDEELEHKADVTASEDLQHADPSTTYSAQTNVLHDLGLTPKEENLARHYLNRHAFLTTLAKNEISLSAIGASYVGGELQAPDHVHMEHITRFEQGDFSDSDTNTLHGAAELAPAYLHERAMALHEIEIQSRSANSAALQMALSKSAPNDVLKEHANETSEQHFSHVSNLAKEMLAIESALDDRGVGQTRDARMLDALDRYLNGTLKLSGVPSTFLTEFKKQRSLMLARLPEMAGIGSGWGIGHHLDFYNIEKNPTHRMPIEDLKTELQSARHTQELSEALRVIPVPIERLPGINQSITDKAAEKALQDMQHELSPAGYAGLQHWIHKIISADKHDTNELTTGFLNFYAAGEADASWIPGVSGVHLTKNEAQVFVNHLVNNRTEYLHELVSGLRHEEVQAAKETLEAGLYNNEPWAQQAERVLNAHASSNGEISDERLASYLENLSKGRISWVHEGLPARFIRIYNDNVEDMTFHKSIRASPIHGVKHDIHAEHERVHAFRKLDQDSEMAVRNIEQDARTPDSEWQYLSAVGAENRVLADMPLLNRQERQTALKSAIQAAYLEMSISDSHSVSLAKLEQYASARDTGQTGQTTLTLLERVFQHGHQGTSDIAAFEQAIEDGKKTGHSTWSNTLGPLFAAHSRDTTLGDQGKVENTLRQIDDGTLQWSELNVPDDFIRLYEKARQSGFEKTLESHEYLAFNDIANNQTWGGMAQDLKSALASHSTNQDLDQEEKIENTLAQIHDGTLAWHDIILKHPDTHDHGKSDIRHIPEDFIHSYEQDLAKSFTDSTDPISTLENLKHLGFSSRFSRDFLMSVDKHLVEIAQDAHHADSYALDRLIAHEIQAGHASISQNLAAMGVGSSERLRMLDALHKILRGDLKPDTMHGDVYLSAELFKNYREDGLASQPATTGIALSSYADPTHSITTDDLPEGQTQLSNASRVERTIADQQHELANTAMTNHERLAVSAIASRNAFDRVSQHVEKQGDFFHRFTAKRSYDHFKDQFHDHLNTAADPTRLQSLEASNIMLSGLMNFPSGQIKMSFVQQVLDERQTQIHELIQKWEQSHATREGVNLALDRVVPERQTGVAQWAAARETLAILSKDHRQLVVDNLNALKADGKHEVTGKHELTPTAVLTEYAMGKRSADSLGVSKDFLDTFNTTRVRVASGIAEEVKFADEAALQGALAENKATRSGLQSILANAESNVRLDLTNTEGITHSGNQSKQDLMLDGLKQILEFQDHPRSSDPIVDRYIAEGDWPLLHAMNSIRSIDPTFITRFKAQQMKNLEELPLGSALAHGINSVQALNPRGVLNEDQLEVLGQLDEKVQEQDSMMENLGVPPKARTWAFKQATVKAIQDEVDYLRSEMPDGSKNDSVEQRQKLEDVLQRIKHDRTGHDLLSFLAVQIDAGSHEKAMLVESEERILDDRKNELQKFAHTLSNERIGAFTEIAQHWPGGSSQIAGRLTAAGSEHDENDSKMKLRDTLTKLENGELSWHQLDIPPKFQIAYQKAKNEKPAYRSMPAILAD